MDGSHIACLIMSLFEALCPQFLLENRLYWLRAPLYIVSSKGKNSYYFNAAELPANVKGEITRCKGLGQMDAEDVEHSMFGPAQRLEQIIPTPEGRKVLRELMGDDVQPRKKFVFSKIDFSTLTT